MKRLGKGLLYLILILVMTWCMGRYGWKFLGFYVTESAEIESVDVMADQVVIKGNSPSFIPDGFTGYVVKEEGSKLYVGYNFSPVFGFFEKGAFEISIPVKNEITEVYTKTKHDEILIWKDGEFVR